jgi:hypothetical protein
MFGVAIAIRSREGAKKYFDVSLKTGDYYTRDKVRGAAKARKYWGSKVR